MSEIYTENDRASGLWNNDFLFELSKRLVESGVVPASTIHHIVDEVTDRNAQENPILGSNFESIRGRYKSNIPLSE